MEKFAPTDVYKRQQQLGEMQQKHQAEVVDLKSKHSTEVTMLNNIILSLIHI